MIIINPQDGRVLQKYPRNADALFLPAGKLDPAFAYIGIIPSFSSRTKPSAPASLAAAMISSRVAPGLP